MQNKFIKELGHMEVLVGKPEVKAFFKRNGIKIKTLNSITSIGITVKGIHIRRISSRSYTEYAVNGKMI